MPRDQDLVLDQDPDQVLGQGLVPDLGPARVQDPDRSQNPVQDQGLHVPDPAHPHVPDLGQQDQDPDLLAPDQVLQRVQGLGLPVRGLAHLPEKAVIRIKSRGIFFCV